MLDLLALIVGVVTTSLIALFVLAKDSRSLTNKLFVGLAVGLVGWTIATYFSLHTATNQQTLFWQRPILFFVVIQSTAFFLLARVFPNYHSTLFRSKLFIAFLIFSGLTALVSLSPFLFVAFKNGSPVPGPGMALFLPFAAISNIGGLIVLVTRTHRARGISRTQLQYFLAGTLLNFTFVPIANFILPIGFKNHSLLAFSPIFSILFSGLIAYGIVVKRLFNIRSAVARSVGYVLVVAAMASLYAIGLFGVINVLFGRPNQETLRQVMSIIMLMPLLILFQYIKGFFDRVTNRLFYRQTYDLREVLDEVGNVVATDIDLVKVLDGSRDVLTGALKCSFMEFMFVRDGELHLKTNKRQLSLPEGLVTQLLSQHTELLAAEMMNIQSPLYATLRSARIALSLRLQTQKQVIGYLLVGEKKNGETYSPQDRRLLTIVADELAIAIQNALQFEEIQQFNRTLQEKVSHATTQLRSSNHRLRELDNTKDDFISMASHQLRTPLTSVKGYLSMVLDGDAGPLNDTQRKLLEQSYRSSQQMVYLISDLLNLSRLNTGKFIIDSSTVKLDELVEFEIGQLNETAKSRNVALVYDKPASFPALMLDETKVHQVVMNLIDNAIYYTRAGGTVTVGLRDTPNAVEFTVKDTGIGVPKSAQHKLFSKFYRAGNAQKARPDGTGLGLFMAKKVIAAQGGAIIFESEEGKGSTFGFRFNKDKHLVTGAAS